jgi:hypothetical protein
MFVSQQKSRSKSEVVQELHNCYVLYERNPDGSRARKPMMMFDRPQDWSNKERWHYNYCVIEVDWNGELIRNHCHIWQEFERDQLKAYQKVAESLFLFISPSKPKQLCDNLHLAEDDFDYSDGELDYAEESIINQSEQKVDGYCFRVWHPNHEEAYQEAVSNPFTEPPFSNAEFMMELTRSGKGYRMRAFPDESRDGLLFISDFEKEELSPLWKAKGWQIESRGELIKISD